MTASESSNNPESTFSLLPFLLGAPPLQSHSRGEHIACFEQPRTSAKYQMQGRDGGVVVVIVAFCEAVSLSLTDVTCDKRSQAAAPNPYFSCGLTSANRAKDLVAALLCILSGLQSLSCWIMPP